MESEHTFLPLKGDVTEEYVALMEDTMRQNAAGRRLLAMGLLPEGVDPADERVVALMERARGEADG